MAPPSRPLAARPGIGTAKGWRYKDSFHITEIRQSSSKAG